VGNPVVHFEIIGKDAAALRTFYGAAFGWQFGQPAPGANLSDYTVVTTGGGSGIDGGIGTAPPGYEGHVTFYVGVPDVAAALEMVKRNGGTPMMGPDQVAGGPIIGLFSDPQGNVIGVVQLP
jgi:predicted enzyme related to lactoylglutathione lyase